jgi:hypothetical protein
MAIVQDNTRSLSCTYQEAQEVGPGRTARGQQTPLHGHWRYSYNPAKSSPQGEDVDVSLIKTVLKDAGTEVHRLFSNYKAKAGIEKAGGVHVFARHTTAP